MKQGYDIFGYSGEGLGILPTTFTINLYCGIIQVYYIDWDVSYFWLSS